MKPIDTLRFVIRNTRSRVESHVQHQVPWLLPCDYDADIVDTILAVHPYTMTPEARIHALCSAVEYVVQNDVPGDIVECGVWRGGSMMAVALTLLRLGDTSRNLYLFDTFAGMAEPGEVDVSHRGTKAQSIWKRRAGHPNGSDWCNASVAEVDRNMRETGYPSHRIHLIEGKVQSTLPGQTPRSISLLRLDTDWYESTRHEMVHLYPWLSSGGVIIIDDYAHWLGARKAVDEYIQENDVSLFLMRIDESARIGVKI